MYIYQKELHFGKGMTCPAPELYRFAGPGQEDELRGSEKIRSLGITKK